jgi:hypothetical protein
MRSLKVSALYQSGLCRRASVTYVPLAGVCIVNSGAVVLKSQVNWRGEDKRASPFAATIGNKDRANPISDSEFCDGAIEQGWRERGNGAKAKTQLSRHSILQSPVCSTCRTTDEAPGLESTLYPKATGSSHGPIQFGVGQFDRPGRMGGQHRPFCLAQTGAELNVLPRANNISV